MILEKIDDPFSVGTILRCAEAFGIKEVLCVMQNAAERAYVRSSMGAIFRLNISVMDSAEKAIAHCRRYGIRVIATTPHCDDDLACANFPRSGSLVGQLRYIYIVAAWLWQEQHVTFLLLLNRRV